MGTTRSHGPLALLTLAHAFGTLNYTAVLAMGPSVQVAVGLSRAEFGLLATAYYGTLLACAVPFGWIVDRLGVRGSLAGGHLVLVLGTALLAQARSFDVAVLAVGLDGAGYALIQLATTKAVLAMFAPTERGTAMGIKQTGVPIGGAAAAGVAALSPRLGWQTVLWLLAAFTTVGAAFTLRLQVPENSRKHAGMPRTLADVMGLVKNRELGVLNLTGSVFSAASITFQTYLVLFVRDVLGTGAAFASLCLGLTYVGGTVGRVAWGVASDRLFGGRRRTGLLLIGGSASVLLGTMAAITRGMGSLFLPIIALLLGGTIASYGGLFQAAVVEASDSRLAAMSMGYSLTMGLTGAMLGPPLFGATVDGTGGYGTGWLGLAAALVSGTALLAKAFEENRSPRSGV